MGLAECNTLQFRECKAKEEDKEIFKQPGDYVT